MVGAISMEALADKLTAIKNSAKTKILIFFTEDSLGCIAVSSFTPNQGPNLGGNLNIYKGDTE